MLHDLARTLVQRGHEVRVVCSAGSYSGVARYPAASDLDGVSVRRLSAPLRSRLGGYLAYFVGAAGVVLWKEPRPDLVLSLTTPPYLGLLSRLAHRRGGAQADWIMDLYPDALLSHGLLGPSSLAATFLRSLMRRQLAASRLVIALGPHMAARVAAYAGARTEIFTLPLWGPSGPCAPEAVRALRAQRGWAESDLVLLYTGNMGLGHRLDVFLEGARRLGGGPVWAFAGGGPRRHEIEAFAPRHPAARVQLLEATSDTALLASLASADVHLVSLRAGWAGVIVPSKLQAAFAVGRPVIFAGPRESEVARWVLESGGGWVVGEDDVDALLRAVEEAQDGAERRRRGAAALEYARKHFDRARNTAAIAERLEGLI
jgi:glycosyltransferase involved in cell wall biosynthesis